MNPVPNASWLATFAVSCALAAPLRPAQDDAKSPDVDRLARQLASIVAAKELVAKPITELLSGWVVGNDLNPHGGVECWDEPGRNLRLALSVAGETDPKKLVDALLATKIPVQGLERVGEPIRGSSPEAEDAIHHLDSPSSRRRTAFWVRSVRVADGIESPYLMARFQSRVGATLEEFAAEIALKKEGYRPAFDTFLAVALRRRQTWQKAGDRFTLDLDGTSVTMAAPAKWTRLEAPDVIAAWEGKTGRIRVTADVPRFPLAGRLAAVSAEEKSILESEGHRLVGEPKEKSGAYEIESVSRVNGAERWHVVRIVEAGGYLFELHADGAFPDPRKTEKIPDAIRREVDKSFASFKAAKR